MDLVIVEVNGVDTRSLSYEETVALLSNPPKLENKSAEIRGIKTVGIGNASNSETPRRDDLDTITLKVVRRLQNEPLSSSAQTCESKTTEKKTRAGLTHIGTTEFQNNANVSDIDRRNTMLTACGSTIISKGGDSEEVAKNVNGPRFVKKSPDCFKPERNETPQYSTKFGYEIIDSEDKMYIQRKKKIQLELNSSHADGNLNENFNHNLTMEVPYSDVHDDLNTCKYVNLEDIQKLTQAYNFDDQPEIVADKNFNAGRYQVPRHKVGMNVNDPRKFCQYNQRYPSTSTRIRKGTNPQRFLLHCSSYIESPGANFTCHSAPHSPLHQSYDSFTNVNVYDRHVSRISPQVTYEIPQNEKLVKYPFMNAIGRKTHDQTKSQKWGSLDYSASRHDYSLASAACGSTHGHASTGTHDYRRQPDEHFNMDTFFQLCTHDVTSNGKLPDKGDRNKNSSKAGAIVTDAKEGMTILADRKQKKKIMSNYLVIRALLSSTEGKLSDGECHPLLSINTV